jgi:cytochrome c-type biogenesis protein CcsB
MALFFVIFSAAMAAATFIENNSGSSASYTMIYGARWFELIIILLAINLAGQLIINRLFRKNKLPVAIFHLAFILMVLGAGITRYFGWEGTMHIRKGEVLSRCFSEGKFIGYRISDDNGNVLAENFEKYSMLYDSKGNFKKVLTPGKRKYTLTLAKIVPNAAESVTDDPAGVPLISLHVSTGISASEDIVLAKGEIKEAGGISIGFSPVNKTDVMINVDSGNFLVTSKYEMGLINMLSSGTRTIERGTSLKLEPMEVISIKDISIVPQRMSLNGILKVSAQDPMKEETGKDALLFQVSSENRTDSVYVWEKETEPVAVNSFRFDNYNFEITCGSKSKALPFSLKLNDFTLERYPGSSSPSGYKSDVTLIDREAGTERPFNIYMNNILKYRGYRFYQESYDKDEMGTILAVNHDVAGITVTYAGYALLFFFIILSLAVKTSNFRNIKASSWDSSLRKKSIVAVLSFIILSGTSAINAQGFVPSKQNSEKFGKVLIQDQGGRTKPLFTLSSDILRKVSGKAEFKGSTPMQVFLGLYFDFDHWKDALMIRVPDKNIQTFLGLKGNMASFSDLVSLEGSSRYKLSDKVNEAYSKEPGARSRIDREVMKIDERVNIIYMVYRGDFMKIFPPRNGRQEWLTPEQAAKPGAGAEDSVYLKSFLPLLAESLQSGKSDRAEQLYESVRNYQIKYAGYSLPSESRTKAEIIYDKLGIFEKLFPFYLAVGFIMLIVLIYIVIAGREDSSVLVRILSWMLFAGFLCHSSGLALRWYIAGHSPMSNGYESMIFISWATILAGFVFRRRSAFSLSATAVLAGLTLMVAHLSFMDPEITNLVPVLKSYWLTLHVSVITGSYGFLGLGAVLGIITMVLLILMKPDNRERISKTIDDLTIINFRTLTLGLSFLTIGTFLGAIWANESWGKYWGWDPKETWSLITIIVYAFITHSRMIPGLKSVFTFNLLSLFGFSSVLMTYFGVNYYLTGMHSYASGEPMSMPVFIYVIAVLLTGISVTAYLKYRKVM